MTSSVRCSSSTQRSRFPARRSSGRSRRASRPPTAASPARRTSSSASSRTAAGSTSIAGATSSTRSRTRWSRSPSTRPARPRTTPSAGDVIEIEQLDGEHFGRIGAQTAKQIILQRIREVERDQVFDQFANREGELLTGLREPGRAAGDHPRRRQGRGGDPRDQRAEPARALPHRAAGQGLRPRGPPLGARAADPRRRTHKGFLQAPVRARGPRDPRRHGRGQGDRPRGGQPVKVAVSSRQEGLDPVGATVGQRGARVQAVVAELAGEKIDVIPWNEDPSVFVANALSPAQVLGVNIDTEHRIANVTVPERMLSLAIGREGQNARLAARLTGWRIDIRSDVAAAEAASRGSHRERRRGADAAHDHRAPTRPRRAAAAVPRPRSPRRAASRGRRARAAAAAAPAPRRPPKPRSAETAKAAEADAVGPPPADGAPADGEAAAGTGEAEANPQGQGGGRRGGGVVGPAAAGHARPLPPRPTPTRSCIACRTARPKRDLLRVVRAPDGQVAIDPTGRAPGRGAYLCRDASCWDAAPGSVPSSTRCGPPSRRPSAPPSSASADEHMNPIAGATSPAPTIDTDHQGGTRGQE